mmetsp:Transcript_16288/g.35314  ORF Transcript_16288/g.35314 Transcript_16288/m.35314 type:complete len:259 (-) Transcript_16288:1180-1956(-)
MNRKPAHELRNHSKPDKVPNNSVREQRLVVAPQLAPEIVLMAVSIEARRRADARGDDLIKAVERAAEHKHDVGGVHRDEIAARVLPPAFFRHVHDRALQHLQQRLLHAFPGHVPRDRHVFRLARDLVHFIDVHHPALRAAHVIVGRHQQLMKNRLHVLAHVTRLRQTRGVHRRVRHADLSRKRLCKKRLPAPGRPHHQHVCLVHLHHKNILLPVVLFIIIFFACFALQRPPCCGSAAAIRWRRRQRVGANSTQRALRR